MQLLRRLGDAAWLMKRHRRRLGRWPNPWRPRTVNDWLMRKLILEPHPLDAQLCCKLGQRAFKAERIGEAASLPLLGAWDSAEALARDWDTLPDAFMLKPTHASSWRRAVPDEAAADRAAVLAEAAGWLARSYYEASREIGYRDVVPRLVAEPLLPSAPGMTTPWEVCVFGARGRTVLAVALATPREGPKPLLVFDAEGHLLPVRQKGRSAGPGPEIGAAAWARMRDLTARLSADLDFVRCDFLLGPGGEVWAGEVTPYPGGGRFAFEPWSWVEWLGGVWTATRAGRPWPEPPAVSGADRAG